MQSAAAAAIAAKNNEASFVYRRATPIEPVMQGRFADFIAGALFRNLVIGVIVLSAILMGVEVSLESDTPAYQFVRRIDQVITAIFVIELLLKLLVFRQRFFRDGWNIFDFLIVAISLVPATETLKVIRTLRVLRILRLLSAIPSMRLVISGLLKAIPGMMSSIALLFIVMYVFAVIGVRLYGGTCYAGYLDSCEPYFGNLAEAFYTLFQIMTLESWSHGIVRPIADVYPSARGFFALYVVVSAFAALNLFIGVVVNAMDSAQQADREENSDEPSLKEVQAELREIKALLKSQT